jgi:hypothetical protein
VDLIGFVPLIPSVAGYFPVLHNSTMFMAALRAFKHMIAVQRQVQIELDVLAAGVAV